MRIVSIGDGDRSLPTLVCLPGAMCSPAVFAEAARLSGLRALALAWLEDDGPFSLQAIAGRVLQSVANEPRIVLVGHSLGTPLAVLAAVQDMQRDDPCVCGLVLSNSGANTRGHGDADAIVRRIEADWGVEFWEAFLARCFMHLPEEPLLHEVRSYPSRVRKEAVVAAIRSQMETDLTPLLGRFGSLPAAIVHGRSDVARTLAHAQQLAAGMPHATLHVLDTGHTSCAEDPAAFAAIMRGIAERAESTKT